MSEPIVVPVLDLASGRAVHASGGDRAGYRPLSERFGLPDDPIELAASLTDRLGARPFYAADLDALEGGPPQVSLLRALSREVASLWCDAGARSAGEAARLRALGVDRVVVGLETLPRWSALEEVVGEVGPAATVFSLDVEEGRPVASPPGGADAGGAAAGRDGAAAELAARATAAGAGAVLVLDLGRVGGRGGPDAGLLSRCRAAAPDVELAVGGGVAGRGDVEEAVRAGASRVLCATALHDGGLPPGEVRGLEAGAGGTDG